VIEDRILAQDRLLELAQLFAGLDPELLDELAPDVAVGLERLGLPPRSVERQHQSASDPLAQGMLEGEGLELADDLPVPSQGELGIDPLLHGGEAKVLQARDVLLEGIFESQVRERSPPPQRKRFAQLARGPPGITGLSRDPGFGHGSLEPIEVELSVIEAKLVARRAGDEDPTGAAGALGLEQVAELGDVHLERLSRRPGRALAPQRLDQPIARDDLVRVQKQNPKE
jgi:hypothetical protein